jgi:hypothetical protein
MQCSRELKKPLWKGSKQFDNFLGKHKAHNYRTLVEKMLETFRYMGCNTSLKMHFLTVIWIVFLS